MAFRFLPNKFPDLFLLIAVGVEAPASTSDSTGCDSDCWEEDGGCDDDDDTGCEFEELFCLLLLGFCFDFDFEAAEDAADDFFLSSTFGSFTFSRFNRFCVTHSSNRLLSLKICI